MAGAQESRFPGRISLPLRVSNPLAVCFVPAAGGVFLDALIAPPVRLWGGFFLVFLFLSLFTLAAARRRPPSAVCHTAAAIFFCGVIFSFFGFWHQVRWSFFPENDIAFLAPADRAPAAVEGVIRTTPVYTEGGPNGNGTTAAEVRTVRIQNKGEWSDTVGTIQVRCEGDYTSYRIGDAVRVVGKISHIRGAENPGQFDRAFRARTRRILVQMNGAAFQKTERTAAMPRYRILRCIETVRLAARDLFARRLSPKNSAVASAVILGLRGGLDEETLEMFRRTGTAHLISVSGLHVSLVALFLFLVIRTASVPVWAKTVFPAAAILGYVLLAGAQPPAVRAAVLFWVLCLSALFRRKAALLNSFAASALILLLANPSNLFLPGVHFSFLATGVFLWFLAPEAASPRSRRKPLFVLRLQARIRLVHLQYRNRPLAAILFHAAEKLGTVLLRITAASLVIEFILLPAILTHLHMCTPLSFLINPIIWIPFEAALISALFLLLFGSVPLLGGFFAFLANGAFSLLDALLNFSQQVPCAWLKLPGPSIWWTAGFYLPFLFWTLFPDRRPRLRVIFLFAGLWLAAGIAVSETANLRARNRGRVEAEILSVGHGGANLLLFPDKTALFDCGTVGEGSWAGNIVQGALFAKGRRTIDLLLLSHADADHYNGVAELLKSVRVRRVAVPPDFFQDPSPLLAELHGELEKRKIPVVTVGKGDSLAPYGFAGLTILHPEKETHYSNTNASSLVLLFEAHGRRILLAGDLDVEPLPAFLTAPIEPYDLVTLPHHGGHSQCTEPLIREGAARWAVASEVSGRISEKTVSVWKSWNPDLLFLCTGDSGAVTVRIEKEKGRNEEKGSFTLRPYRFPARPPQSFPEPVRPR